VIRELDEGITPERTATVLTGLATAELAARRKHPSHPAIRNGDSLPRRPGKCGRESHLAKRDELAEAIPGREF
jgi:hypothetical protein